MTKVNQMNSGIEAGDEGKGIINKPGPLTLDKLKVKGKAAVLSVMLAAGVAHADLNGEVDMNNKEAQAELVQGGVDHKTFQKNLRTEIKKIEIDIQTLQQKGVDNGGMSQEDMMTLFSLMNTKEGLNQTLLKSEETELNQIHETISNINEKQNQGIETISNINEKQNQGIETIEEKLTAIENLLENGS